MPLNNLTFQARIYFFLLVFLSLFDPVLPQKPGYEGLEWRSSLEKLREKYPDLIEIPDPERKRFGYRTFRVQSQKGIVTQREFLLVDKKLVKVFVTLKGTEKNIADFISKLNSQYGLPHEFYNGIDFSGEPPSPYVWKESYVQKMTEGGLKIYKLNWFPPGTDVHLNLERNKQNKKELIASIAYVAISN